MKRGARFYSAAALLAAAVGLGPAWLIGGEAGLMPVLPIAWSDLLPLLACPLAAGAVAALAARTTALTLLKEMT